jgi:hypothetical protein
MSSPGLPALTLDIAARRGERLVALVGLTLAVCAIFLTDVPFSMQLALAVPLTALLAVQFAAIGWLGGKRRIARVVCQQSGHWVLYEAGGRQFHADLSAATRVTKQVVWLCWSGREWRPLLLLAGDLPPQEYRRLFVRLRLAPFPHSDEAHDAP